MKDCVPIGAFALASPRSKGLDLAVPLVVSLSESRDPARLAGG